MLECRCQKEEAGTTAEYLSCTGTQILSANAQEGGLLAKSQVTMSEKVTLNHRNTKNSAAQSEREAGAAPTSERSTEALARH